MRFDVWNPSCTKYSFHFIQYQQGVSLRPLVTGRCPCKCLHVFLVSREAAGFPLLLLMLTSHWLVSIKVDWMNKNITDLSELIRLLLWQFSLPVSQSMNKNINLNIIWSKLRAANISLIYRSPYPVMNESMILLLSTSSDKPPDWCSKSKENV